MKARSPRCRAEACSSQLADTPPAGRTGPDMQPWDSGNRSVGIGADRTVKHGPQSDPVTAGIGFLSQGHTTAVCLAVCLSGEELRGSLALRM